jgi:HEAT repeat protein
MNEEARRAAVLRLSSGEADLAALIEALGDESWRVRKEAAVRAAEWADRARAAEALVAALAEPENVGRRNAAVEGLARLGPIALPALVDSLGAQPEHRKLIIDTLGMLGDRRAGVPLAASLDDPDENVRAAAAEALGRLGGPEAEVALAKALTRGELLLSVACLDALNRLRARLPVEALVPLTRTAVLRPSALEALGLSGDAEAVPYLLVGLTDPARGAREAATQALGRLHEALGAAGEEARRRVEATLRALPEDAEKMLVEQLLEASPGSRRAAASLLGWARRAHAVRPLMLALGDPDVQEAAAEAISLIGAAAVAEICTLSPELDGNLKAAVFALLPRLGPAAADARVQNLLTSALEDEDQEASAAAARALGEVGGKDALPALVNALSGPSRVAAAAAQALGRLGGRYYEEVRMLVHARGLHQKDAPYLCRVLGALGRGEDAPHLLGAMRDESQAVRRAAAEALAGIGGAPGPATRAEVEDALCFALADEAPEVRAAAARTLGTLASGRAVEALAGACADGDPSVRAAAARALGTIGGSAAFDALRTLARQGDGATVVQALEALGRAGDDTDEALLVGALEREDAEVVKAAARALSTLGGVRAVEGLARALAHARWDVRRVAAQSLGERGGTGALALLRARHAVEDDALVREALAGALERAARR